MRAGERPAIRSRPRLGRGRGWDEAAPGDALPWPRHHRRGAGTVPRRKGRGRGDARGAGFHRDQSPDRARRGHHRADAAGAATGDLRRAAPGQDDWYGDGVVIPPAAVWREARSSGADDGISRERSCRPCLHIPRRRVRRPGGESSLPISGRGLADMQSGAPGVGGFRRRSGPCRGAGNGAGRARPGRAADAGGRVAAGRGAGAVAGGRGIMTSRGAGDGGCI